MSQPSQAPKPKPLTMGVGATVDQRTDAGESAFLRGKDGAHCTHNAAHSYRDYTFVGQWVSQSVLLQCGGVSEIIAADNFINRDCVPKFRRLI